MSPHDLWQAAEARLKRDFAAYVARDRQAGLTPMSFEMWQEVGEPIGGSDAELVMLPADFFGKAAARCAGARVKVARPTEVPPKPDPNDPHWRAGRDGFAQIRAAIGKVKAP